VEWGYVPENLARGVRLPTLKTVRKKWVLSTAQATSLLEVLPPLARTMVGLALLSGVRRGELFPLRWRDVDLAGGQVHIREAVYEGQFGTPKTEAGVRTVRLFEQGVALLADWRRQVKRTRPDDLVFATHSGKAIWPDNVLRRWVRPGCDVVGLPRVSWLTFRRTYATWAHEKGVPGKTVAQVMGHAEIDTTLNVYTQVLPESVRAAVSSVGEELFKNCAVAEWDERANSLKRVARRTGRFPQLADPRGRVNGLFLTGSPRFRDHPLGCLHHRSAASAAAKANGTTFANLYRRSVPRLGCRNRVPSTTGPLQFPVGGTP
jgi:Phage integrase family